MLAAAAVPPVATANALDASALALLAAARADEAEAMTLATEAEETAATLMVVVIISLVVEDAMMSTRRCYGVDGMISSGCQKNVGSGE